MVVILFPWWNGELFLVSGETTKDLLLGVTITLFTLTMIPMEVNSQYTNLDSNIPEDYINRNDVGVIGVRASTETPYWATFQFDYFNMGNTTGNAPETNNIIWKFILIVY